MGPRQLLGSAISSTLWSGHSGAVAWLSRGVLQHFSYSSTRNVGRCLTGSYEARCLRVTWSSEWRTSTTPTTACCVFYKYYTASGFTWSSAWSTSTSSRERWAHLSFAVSPITLVVQVEHSVWYVCVCTITVKTRWKVLVESTTPRESEIWGFCREHLATLATPTIRSIKCTGKQSLVYGVFWPLLPHPSTDRNKTRTWSSLSP